MTVLFSKSDQLQAIAGIRPPDSRIAQAAMELARDVSSPMLFNHAMRCYWFAELLAAPRFACYDREILFISLVLHDLGLTPHAHGPRRFEIEGAVSSRRFVLDRGFAEDKAWLVWDNIALHPLDLNAYKEPEAQAVELGICADVLGLGLEPIDRAAISEICSAFPRLNLKREFFRLLQDEAAAKPHQHLFHPCTMVAHHQLGGVQIPDARALMNAAPFDE